MPAETIRSALRRSDVRVADRAPCPAAELHVSEAGTGQGNRQRLPLRGRKRQVGEYVSRFAFHSIRLSVVKLGNWGALCRHQAQFISLRSTFLFDSCSRSFYSSLAAEPDEVVKFEQVGP